MKNFKLLFLLFVLPSFLLAQQFIKNTTGRALTFKEIQKQFEIEAQIKKENKKKMLIEQNAVESSRLMQMESEAVKEKKRRETQGISFLLLFISVPYSALLSF